MIINIITIRHAPMSTEVSRVDNLKTSYYVGGENIGLLATNIAWPDP